VTCGGGPLPLPLYRAHYRPDGMLSVFRQRSCIRVASDYISDTLPRRPRTSFESGQIESGQIAGIIGRLPTSEFLPSRMAGV